MFRLTLALATLWKVAMAGQKSSRPSSIRPFDTLFDDSGSESEHLLDAGASDGKPIRHMRRVVFVAEQEPQKTVDENSGTCTITIQGRLTVAVLDRSKGYEAEIEEALKSKRSRVVPEGVPPEILSLITAFSVLSVLESEKVEMMFEETASGGLVTVRKMNQDAGEESLPQTADRETPRNPTNRLPRSPAERHKLASTREMEADAAREMEMERNYSPKRGQKLRVIFKRNPRGGATLVVEVVNIFISVWAKSVRPRDEIVWIVPNEEGRRK